MPLGVLDGKRDLFSILAIASGCLVRSVGRARSFHNCVLGSIPVVGMLPGYHGRHFGQDGLPRVSGTYFRLPPPVESIFFSFEDGLYRRGPSASCGNVRRPKGAELEQY